MPSKTRWVLVLAVRVKVLSELAWSTVERGLEGEVKTKKKEETARKDG
jgi:hypothetical protein